MSTDTAAPAAPVEVADEVVDRAEFKDGQPIVAYTRTEQALAELRQRYEGAKFDLTTTAGDKAARAARLALVTLRNDLEKRRKSFKAPALEFGRLIDDEAKRIHSQIVALEDPIDDQIRADERRREDERQAREAAERERAAKLRVRIDYMRGVAARAAGKPSAEVRAKLDMMRSLTVGDDFGELKPEAQQVREEVLQILADMAVAVEAQEAQAERLRVEQEAHARRVAMEDKLAAISRMADGMGRAGSEKIEAVIERVRSIVVAESEWGEYTPRAVHAVASVMTDLSAMLEDAHHLERVAAEQAEEARRQAQQRAELEEREQLQSLADAEASVANAPSVLIGNALALMNSCAHARMGSKAVQDARLAAIVRLRAHRDRTAAKEADALRVEQERSDNAAVADRSIDPQSPMQFAHGLNQDSQRQESEGAPALTDQSPIAPLGTVQAEGEAAVPAAVSPGSCTADDLAQAPPPSGAGAVPEPELPTIKLGELCAEVGEGFKVTEFFVTNILGVEPSGTDKRAVLYTVAKRRQILLALRDRLDGLAGGAT